MTDVIAALQARAQGLSIFEGTAHATTPGMVSVVIPNHNKGAYIEDCLTSIIKQTYSLVEIVFIDDCSTDNSYDIAQKVLSNHVARERCNQGKLHLTTLQLPRRVGTAWAQNIGYYLARGEFLANQDSDDASMPQRLAKQVAFLTDNADVSAVGSDYHQFTGPTEVGMAAIDRGPYTPTPWLAFGVDAVRQAYEAHTHRVCWGTLLMRAPVINIIGGNTKRCLGAEDFECILRMVQAGLNVDNLSEKLYLYRKSATQRSTLFHGASGQ
jgi:glycosyltransferase involved in cell wall biosynthesis